MERIEVEDARTPAADRLRDLLDGQTSIEVVLADDEWT